MGCAAFAGIFFTVTAYFMVFGMGHDTALRWVAAQSPFGDVAARAGLGVRSHCGLYRGDDQCVCLRIGEYQCRGAPVVLRGKYPVSARSDGRRVHHVHHTPHCAIVFCGVLLGAISIALTPIGLLDAYGCSGTFASFGFVVVYLAICIVAPMDLRRGR